MIRSLGGTVALGIAAAVLAGCATTATPGTGTTTSAAQSSQSATAASSSNSSPTSATASSPSATSEPPQSSPPSGTETPGTETTETTAPDDLLQLLNLRTFKLVGLFTDAGGVDTMYDDAKFVITFHGDTATAVTNCGKLTYSGITVVPGGLNGDQLALGDPTGPACSMGTDPSGVPSGRLSWGRGNSDGYYWLSTGFVGWVFSEIISTEPTSPCPPDVQC